MIFHSPLQFILPWKCSGLVLCTLYRYMLKGRVIAQRILSVSFMQQHLEPFHVQLSIISELSQSQLLDATPVHYIYIVCQKPNNITICTTINTCTVKSFIDLPSHMSLSTVFSFSPFVSPFPSKLFSKTIIVPLYLEWFHRYWHYQYYHYQPSLKV